MPEKPSKIQEFEVRLRLAWSSGAVKALVWALVAVCGAGAAVLTDVERFLSMLPAVALMAFLAASLFIYLSPDALAAPSSSRQAFSVTYELSSPEFSSTYWAVP